MKMTESSSRKYKTGYSVWYLGTLVAEDVTLDEARRLVAEDRYNRRLHWIPDRGAACISLEEMSDE